MKPMPNKSKPAAKIEQNEPGLTKEELKEMGDILAAQIKTRQEELKVYSQEELKQMVLFLENRMGALMLELEMHSNLDERKEEILDSDMSDEELEDEFESIKQELEIQMMASNAFLTKFDEQFRKLATPRLVEELLDSDEDDEDDDA
jgi:hypothetical protein